MASSTLQIARALSIAIAVLAFAGCQETQHCAAGMSYQNGECRPLDAGTHVPFDAGTDTNDPCAACGAQHCVPTRDAGACVECVALADCVQGDAGRADGGAPLGTHICVDFHCVAGCETTGQCGNNLCRSDHTCSAYGNGAQAQCEPCDDDMNCARGSDCVETFYGAASDGRHCMAQFTGTACSAPYVNPNAANPSHTVVRASTRGMSFNYCVLNESLTTCAAVLALEAGRSCTSMTSGPMECATNGGLCRDVSMSGTGPFVCTYPCMGQPECPSGLVCASYCRH